MTRSSFADRSRLEKTIMANARPRLFTRQEIIESFYTPGSDDEGNSYGEMLEDDREDETDVREIDIFNNLIVFFCFGFSAILFCCYGNSKSVCVYE